MKILDNYLKNITLPRLLLIGISFIILTLILTAFFKAVIYGTIALVLIFGFLIFFKGYKEKKRKEENDAKKDVNSGSEDISWNSEHSIDELIECLYVMNLNVVKSHVIDKNLREKIRLLSLSLKNCAEELDSYIGRDNVLFWKIKQISMDFLPKLVNRFIASRGQMEDKILDILSEMKTKTLKIEEEVKNKNLNELEYYSNALSKIIENKK